VEGSHSTQKMCPEPGGGPRGGPKKKELLPNITEKGALWRGRIRKGVTRGIGATKKRGSSENGASEYTWRSTEKKREGGSESSHSERMLLGGKGGGGE